MCRADDESSQKDENGFKSLFNGKSLDGWEIMNDGKFAAEDGVIKLNGGQPIKTKATQSKLSGCPLAACSNVCRLDFDLHIF